MTTDQAANYLGVNPSRVRQLVRSGLLVVEREETRRGPVFWFRQKDLDAYRQLREEKNQERTGKRGRPYKTEAPAPPADPTPGTPDEDAGAPS